MTFLQLYYYSFWRCNYFTLLDIKGALVFDISFII